MKDGIKNFKTMMQNPKSRNIYLALAGVGVATVTIGWIFSSGNTSENTMGGNAQVVAAPTLRAIPGSSDSQRYNEMVQKNNEIKQEEALEATVPFVPTIVNSQFNAASPIDMLSMEEQRDRERKQVEDEENAERERMQALALESLKAPEPPPAPVATPVVIAPPPMIVAPPPMVPAEPLKYSGNDYLLIGALTAASRNYPPSSERDYFGKEAESSNNSAVISQGSSRQEVVQTTSANMAQVTAADQKAGDMIHAVLDTGINSSEPSPIMATVVSGQFKGAKLLGRFTRSGKKVVLQFNTISIPGQPKSTNISAVAMDPDTKRSSMATDVDNHYFLRYGVLLASTFLSGYAEAISNRGSTTTVSDGVIIQDSGEKSSKDINREAIGSVGQELANQTKSQIQGLEPTIYVDGGTAIGILFMEDFYLNGENGNPQSANTRGNVGNQNVGIRNSNPY